MSASAQLNPAVLCVPSQNGFVLDWPQRQSHAWSSIFSSVPSPRTSVNGPFTWYEPFGLGWITTSAIGTLLRGWDSVERAPERFLLLERGGHLASEEDRERGQVEPEEEDQHRPDHPVRLVLPEVRHV